MQFDQLKIGSVVKCPIPDHKPHTVVALPREAGYGSRIEAIRWGKEPTHFAQFDDGSMLSQTNPAVADFELIDEVPC